MSAVNFNKALGFVSSCFRWARLQYVEVAENPLEGLKLPVVRDVRNERHSFSTDQLQRIFKGTVYSECHSARRWSLPDPHLLRGTGKFLVPLVSLYTGGRLGEIVQLRIDNVCIEENIPYLDINDDGDDKRLKTISSARRIPIHEELVRLGFLEYVDEMRGSGNVRVSVT